MLIRYNKNLIIILCVFALFQVNILAQEIIFKHLTVDNGLSNNKVNCLLEDRLGFIWFGTEDGLNRFDGYNIKVYRHQENDKNSISSNGIWAMFEDEEGYLWIGTKSGEINRFNPMLDRFEHWKVESNITNENSVTSLFKDSKGNIWIGTYRNGLYQFDLEDKKFINWKYEANNEKSLSNNYVTSILEDEKGNYWISTYNGLNKFNPSVSLNNFSRFYNNPADVSTISNNLIWNLIPFKSQKNKFWIGTAKGLDIYDSNSSSFTHFNIPIDKKVQFGTSVGSIIEEASPKEKVYWIGTYAGLIKLNSENNNIKRFICEENNPFCLTSNQINTMLKDRSGVIWIATENGINYFSSKEIRFNNYFNQNTIGNHFEWIRKNNITSIIQFNNRSIWIGSPKGLSLINGFNQIDKLKSEQKFSNLNVWSLCSGYANNIWIGTYGQGLKVFNLSSNTLNSIPIKSDIILPSMFLYIKSVFQDKDRHVWIGCWGSGLVRYDVESAEYRIFINDEANPNSLSYNDVWAIDEDQSGNLWVGTNGGGLNLFDKKSEKFFRLQSDFKNANGLSSNSIYSIYVSKNSKIKSTENTTVLWVGTSNGLNKVTINNIDYKINNNRLKADVRSYKVENGLPDNSIKSIVEDGEGNLWLGTSNGLSQFDPDTEKFINYSTSDGLTCNDFNFSSSLKTEDGLIFLGGNNGLNIFNPKEIKQSSYKPPILITDFQLFNKSVSIGEGSPLMTNISFTNEILLSYDQNIFSFQFSALDYNSPNSIQYAYKMEGFDNEWIYSRTRRYAAYTNLSPGTYYFHLKATNSDGVWNDNSKTIKVVINSPWWKTGWAYLIFLSIIFLGLVGIRRFELNLVRLRNELKMREFESKKHREIENVKSRFFANLSHEFRTPLMLIKGPLEQLREGKIKDNLKSIYEMIYRNTENLHSLIDQLLELTQIEVESIPVKARKENIITLLQGFFNSFKSVAEQKSILLEFLSDSESICAWIDRDKLEKVINNLLSNSIKFTPNGGKISLSLKIIQSEIEEFAEIKISDTGIGIPEDKLHKIFDRFYQVDNSASRAYGGSGIGLSLVKEFVDLHKWKIECKSKIDEGTDFILTIPLSESYLPEKQKIKDEYRPDKKIADQSKEKNGRKPSHVSNNIMNNKIISEEIEALSDKFTSKTNKPTILVVEDSLDVQQYILSLLQNDYNILQAENAEDGLKKALDFFPDLILSDIMMPGIDGMEFCRQIKTNFQTSHIPVILLTAKVSQESKIEGLETGADDYITKPFNFREFSTRIKNLLEQRKRLKEKFSKEINTHPSDITVNSLDTEFLEKAFKVVEKNIYNIDFDLEAFSEEMFLSRSQLYRKMIAITGQAPGEFIRAVKLKKAAKMILERKLSVTQIALEVGFSSPSHFTKAFQQYFNCLPSDFASTYSSNRIS